MTPARKRAASLRVVSWNLGRLYSPWHNNRLEEADLARVAAVLTELDADVVALQELVDLGQLARILRETSVDRAYLGQMASCRYDRHAALLVRAELAPRFSEHILEPSGRGAVAASFVSEGHPAYALAVHFDVFAPARRRIQAEAAATLVTSRPERLLLVAGDFNFDPDWAERLRQPLDRESWRRLKGALTDVGRAAGPTLMGLLRLDHVLAGGAALQSFRATVSPRRLPLGDHHPLVATLGLRAVDVDEPTS